MSTNKKQTAVQALSDIQQKLNAPKGQYNKFGNYSYRSCEDILQAVKPLLGESAILISDDIKVVGDRIYVQATATFYHSDEKISNVAYAREPLAIKGMSESQITGAASSYARKYALNGLLLIDDNKDADSMDNSQKSEQPHPNSKQAKEAKKIAREQNETAVYIANAVAKNDMSSALEAYNELSQDELSVVWRLLNTKEQQSIRDAINATSQYVGVQD